MDGKELNLNSEYARLYFKDKAEKKAEKKMTDPLKMFVPESVGELYDEVNFKNKQNNNEFLNQIINIIINDYQNIIQNSEEIFENRLKEDGWAEDIGEGAVKIWNLFTCGDWEGHTASKIREDFQMAQVYIEELKAAQKNGSAEQLNETFKKIYGKNFDKETIDKYLEENKKYTDITVSYAELEEYKSKTNTLRNGDSYTKAMDYNYSESNFNIDMENLNEHIKLYENKMKSFYEKRGINIDFEQIYQKAGVYEEEQEYPEKPKDGFKTDDEKREYWLKCMDIKVANKHRLKKMPPIPEMGFKTPQDGDKYYFECKDIKRRNENCKNYKKFCALRNFANQQNEMFSNILKDKYKTMGIEGNDFKQMYLSAKKKNDKAYENAFGSTNKLMKTVTEYQNAQKFRGEFVKGVGLFAGTMLTAGTLGAPMAAATTSFLVESSNQMTSGMKKSVDGYGVKSFGKALGEKIKKEGLSSVIKDVAVKGLENIKFKENGINAATVGAVTIVIGGTGYLVDNISKFAGASKLTSAIYSGISEIGAGVGTEYALTGEVTVKGTVYVVLFTITGKVLSLIPKTQNPIKDLQKMIEGDSALKELGKTIDWKNLSKKDLKTILNAMSNAYYPIREGVGNSEKFIAYNSMLDACKLKLAGKWIVQDMANPKKALPAPESSTNPEIMPKAQTSVSAENSVPVSTTKVVPKQNSPAMRALTPQPIKGSVEPVTAPKTGVNPFESLRRQMQRIDQPLEPISGKEIKAPNTEPVEVKPTKKEILKQVQNDVKTEVNTDTKPVEAKATEVTAAAESLPKTQEEFINYLKNLKDADGNPLYDSSDIDLINLDLLTCNETTIENLVKRNLFTDNPVLKTIGINSKKGVTRNMSVVKALAEMKPEVYESTIQKVNEIYDAGYKVININKEGSMGILNPTSKNIIEWHNHDSDIYILKNGNTKKMLIPTSDGVYVSNAVDTTGKTPRQVQNELSSACRKIDKSPSELTISNIEELLLCDSENAAQVYKSIPMSPDTTGHAEINLSQGKNTVSPVNGTTVSQLDNAAKPNSTSERTVYHYPDGRVSAVDFELDTHSTLKPNQNGNGMTLVKHVGNTEINLSTEVNGYKIKITNNLDGSSKTYDLFNIIAKTGSDDLFISLSGNVGNKIKPAERLAKIPELFKKLSPTTVLDIIDIAESNPNTSFPYLKSSLESSAKEGGLLNIAGKDISLKPYVTLSDSAPTVTHEVTHNLTHRMNLLNNPDLVKLHAEEASKAQGLLKHLSQYAIDGNGKNQERGLSELISIATTMGEYGTELAQRTEAIRLAFPKTIAKIQELITNHQLELIEKMK